MESTTRILRQDLDSDIRILIARLLADDSHRVSTCEAVLAVEAIKPDLIFRLFSVGNNLLKISTG